MGTFYWWYFLWIKIFFLIVIETLKIMPFKKQWWNFHFFLITSCRWRPVRSMGNVLLRFLIATSQLGCREFHLEVSVWTHPKFLVESCELYSCPTNRPISGFRERYRILRSHPFQWSMVTETAESLLAQGALAVLPLAHICPCTLQNSKFYFTFDNIYDYTFNSYNTFLLT